MKKIISILTIISILSLLIFTGSSYAATLDAIDIKTDKTTVRPGEEVKVNIEFGQSLGAYTFNVSYDNNIFNFVSAEGGTESDTTDKVKVVYHDTTGGTNPRTNMSVTFKAKEDITTSNPTEFTITAEGLANADASETYDDITTPIVKNVTVEPAYEDYNLKLEYTGEVVKGQDKEMTLSYSSTMGRYYEHARLIAEATTPTDATVKLVATDDSNLEHDIIQSGWGDAQGYKIGGKDVSQVLKTKGTFSTAGDYTINLKLIDRDNSDQIIAEKAVKISVVETPTTTEPPTTTPEKPETPEPPATPETPEKPTTPETSEVPETTTPEETPKILPKTGTNMYVPIIIVLIALVSSYVYYNRKK